MSISLENVTFRFARSESVAIKNIDLKIRRGEVVGILGATGSGKTTLLSLLNGLIPREVRGQLTGRVLVDGLDVKNYSVPEMTEHVGMVLPDPTLSIVGITVEDDLAFGPTWLGLATEEIQERVKWAAEMVRLSGYEKRNTSYLSGGEQQALCIGGVLALKPRILALDEPITMLDPVGKSQIVSVVRELNHEVGSTVLITEGGADIEYISPLLDRCVVLRRGEVLLDGRPEEVFTEEKLLRDALVMPPQTSQLVNRLGRFAGAKTTKTTIGVDETCRQIAKLMGKLRTTRIHSVERKRKKTGRNQEPIILVKNVYHHFQGAGDGVFALNGVDLEVWPGEFIGLIGRNGSGKTTLSLHLIGELKPTNPDAKVTVNGIDVLSKGFQQNELVRHINYVFQNPDDQFFSGTVWEEITFGLKALGLSEMEIKKRAQETLRFFGLADLRDESTSYLSRDEKTFLAAACVVVLEPRILIVDEPTRGLDYWKGEEMIRKLRSLNTKRGTTIIIITHNMRLVAEHVDRVVVLRDGKVFVDGTPREVLADAEKLEEASLAPPPVTQVSQSLERYGFPRGVLDVDEFFEVLGLGGEA